MEDQEKEWRHHRRSRCVREDNPLRRQIQDYWQYGYAARTLNCFSAVGHCFKLT